MARIGSTYWCITRRRRVMCMASRSGRFKLRAEEEEGLADGGCSPAQASTAPESAPVPHGPVFRIQLQGFATPFTTSTVVGPEDWLTLNVGRKNAAGQEGKTGDEEVIPGTEHCAGCALYRLSAIVHI